MTIPGLHPMRLPVRLLRAAALAFTAAVMLAAAVPARGIEIQRVEGGGVEAWLVEDHSVPVLSVSLAFRNAGAVSDPAGAAGRARMAAALLDEGAGDLEGAAYQARLEDLAASVSFNARLDALEGALRTLSEHREEAFRLLGLAVTAPRFDPEPVERVRSQLLADLRQADQDPGERAQARLYQLVFPDHPYGRGADGDPADVEALSADDLRRYVSERLAKDVLILGVVGDITAAQLSVLLERTFANLPPAAAPLDVETTRPAATGDLAVIELPVPQSVVRFAQPGPRRDDPDYYTLTVLNHVLGGGSFTSRLFQEVREARGLVYSVSTSLRPQRYSGLWLGSAATANNRVAQTVELIREEWRKMAEDGPTDAEVDAAKTFLIGSFPLRFTSSGRIARILTAMQRADLGIDYLDRRNDLIAGVTADDVRKAAKEWLQPDRLTVVVAGQPVGLEPTN